MHSHWKRTCRHPNYENARGPGNKASKAGLQNSPSLSSPGGAAADGTCDTAKAPARGSYSDDHIIFQKESVRITPDICMLSSSEHEILCKYLRFPAMNSVMTFKADIYVALQEYRNTFLQQAPHLAWGPSEGFICNFVQRIQYISSLYIHIVDIIEYNRVKTYSLLIDNIIGGVDSSISIQYIVPYWRYYHQL